MAGQLAVRHGKYRIAVARSRHGGAVARAFLGARCLHAFGGPSPALAVAQARRWLDDHDRALRERRRGGRPTVEEYRRALVHLPLTVEHEALLRAHAGAAARTATARELAAAIGLGDGDEDGPAAAAELYDQLGRMVAGFVGFTPPAPEQRGRPLWAAAIAAPRPPADGGPWSWELFPEVAAALEALEAIWSHPVAAS